MPRLRDLGIATGTLPVGQRNAITDVAGVRVGFTTLIRDQPNVVRTGVTAIWPLRTFGPTRFSPVRILSTATAR